MIGSLYLSKATFLMELDVPKGIFISLVVQIKLFVEGLRSVKNSSKVLPGLDL